MKVKSNTGKDNQGELSSKRESPQDFWLAYLAWIAKTGRKTVTAKGYAIIREQERKEKK